MTQQIIYIGTAPNTGDGDPARTAFSKVNANFTELYAAIVTPIVLINQTGNFTQGIAIKTWLEKLVIAPQLGTPSVKIGTTLGGNDIIDTTPVDSSLPVMIQHYYDSGISLYFTVTGGNVNINFDSKVIFP